jgi:uncharacterized protein YbjQ (UPF0145 family)
MAECTKCGNKVGMLSFTDLCSDCEKAARQSAQQDVESHKLVAQKRFNDLTLTTAPSIEGYRVIETLEILTAECVHGMDALQDLFAAVRDVVGGRSDATQKVLRDLRKQCLNELRIEADSIGANAVIAVGLDYSEFSGQGKSMLFLVASGTAVKVVKDPS